MKLFMFIGLFCLVAGIGCQSATSTTADRAKTGNSPEITKKVERDSATKADPDALSSEKGDNEAPRILVEDAKTAFDDSDAFFIDTRGSSIYQNEHVKSAVNIPAYDIEKRFEEIPKDKTIIVYCS